MCLYILCGAVVYRLALCSRFKTWWRLVAGIGQLKIWQNIPWDIQNDTKSVPCGVRCSSQSITSAVKACSSAEFIFMFTLYLLVFTLIFDMIYIFFFAYTQFAIGELRVTCGGSMCCWKDPMIRRPKHHKQNLSVSAHPLPWWRVSVCSCTPLYCLY